MKIRYSPNGQSGKKPVPKQWEVWLADTTFGPTGKKRCPVLVGKRGNSGFTVFEVVSSAQAGGSKDVSISDYLRAGQDRPCAAKVGSPCMVQIPAFVQRMGEIHEEDIKKVISAMRV